MRPFGRSRLGSVPVRLAEIQLYTGRTHGLGEIRVTSRRQRRIGDAAGPGLASCLMPVAEASRSTTLKGSGRADSVLSRGTRGPGHRPPASFGAATPSLRGLCFGVFETVLSERCKLDEQVQGVSGPGRDIFHVHEHRFVLYGSGRTRTGVCKMACRMFQKPFCEAVCSALLRMVKELDVPLSAPLPERVFGWSDGFYFWIPRH